jgi:hypothetical protein
VRTSGDTALRKSLELDGWHSERAAGVSSESVRITQPVVALSDAGARRLGDRYWAEVAAASRGLVRGSRTRHGLELRALGRWPVLLRLAGPETLVDARGPTCRYRVVGGLLARLPAGTLTLSQSSEPPYELRATVTEYVPRLGTRLYEHLQQRIHVAISRRFFRALIEEAGR